MWGRVEQTALMQHDQMKKIIIINSIITGLGKMGNKLDNNNMRTNTARGTFHHAFKQNSFINVVIRNYKVI